jgi:uncharacterized protein (DUF1810 family)
MDKPFNLDRFVEAQEPVYSNVIAELKAGRKTSHWMWFIFPQIAGLGHSAMAQKYAITSADEAAAYLAHPLLGQRLRGCSALVAAIDDKEIGDIFGAPDEAVFQDCINKFFDGVPDQATVERL